MHKSRKAGFRQSRKDAMQEKPDSSKAVERIKKFFIKNKTTLL
jgi:hypothetical protein